MQQASKSIGQEAELRDKQKSKQHKTDRVGAVQGVCSGRAGDKLVGIGTTSLLFLNSKQV